ncbi:MAG: hypothetical protein NTZ97_03380 [Candidatus Moranbacteria bacterium]|nr:hypothetical protein [Candidatus Moranbacteria bacterium]
MEIKIIFRNGISDRKYAEIEGLGLGETILYGRSDKKNPVMFSLIIKGTKKRVAEKLRKLMKIIEK